jgi:hypothetical protein
VTLGANSFSVTGLQNSQTVSNSVNYFNPLTITWALSVDGGATYLPMGTTTNVVYVTLDTPTASPLFRTVLHLACTNGQATDLNTAIANTWALFAGRNVTTWDGHPLTYYATPTGGDCYETACLLSTHEGQCHSFASLLRDCFRANGDTTIAITRVNPPAGHDLFGVRNIGTLGTSFPPPYQYHRIDLDPSVAGIPGQNTDPPQAKIFERHFVVHRGTGSEYYDPSYGVTTTGAADFTSNIAFWRRSADARWRDATGSGLELIFTDDPP